MPTCPDCPNEGGAGTLSVIGAGFGRTGTRSMVEALERLGYKTYHGQKVIGQGHVGSWAAVELEEGNATNATALDAILTRIVDEGFTAALDFPVCVAFETLMRRYPHALVLLTLRSSPEVWAASFVETVARMTPLAFRPPYTWLTPGSGSLHRWALRQAGVELDADTLMPTVSGAAAAYRSWEQRVRAVVPPDRLLVHAPEDGWRPLCTWLRVPVGSCPADHGEPYPRARNDRLTMHQHLFVAEFVAQWWSFPIQQLALLCLVIFALQFYCLCCWMRSGKRSRRPKED